MKLSLKMIYAEMHEELKEIAGLPETKNGISGAAAVFLGELTLNPYFGGVEFFEYLTSKMLSDHSLARPRYFGSFLDESEFARQWANNLHFTEQAYIQIYGRETSYWQLSNIIGEMRNHAWMNDTAANLLREGRTLKGAFSTNINGTEAWLTTLVDVRGLNAIIRSLPSDKIEKLAELGHISYSDIYERLKTTDPSQRSEWLGRMYPLMGSLTPELTEYVLRNFSIASVRGDRSRVAPLRHSLYTNISDIQNSLKEANAGQSILSMIVSRLEEMQVGSYGFDAARNSIESIYSTLAAEESDWYWVYRLYRMNRSDHEIIQCIESNKDEFVLNNMLVALNSDQDMEDVSLLPFDWKIRILEASDLSELQAPA